MKKATYAMVKDFKKEGETYQLSDGENFQAIISFEKGDKKLQITIDYTWCVDGDMEEGHSVDCSIWMVETKGHSEAIQAFKELYPEFVWPKGSRQSAEIAVSDLEYDFEQVGILKV